MAEGVEAIQTTLSDEKWLFRGQHLSALFQIPNVCNDQNFVRYIFDFGLRNAQENRSQLNFGQVAMNFTKKIKSFRFGNFYRIRTNFNHTSGIGTMALY